MTCHILPTNQYEGVLRTVSRYFVEVVLYHQSRGNVLSWKLESIDRRRVVEQTFGSRNTALDI